MKRFRLTRFADNFYLRSFWLPGQTEGCIPFCKGLPVERLAWGRAPRGCVDTARRAWYVSTSFRQTSDARIVSTIL